MKETLSPPLFTSTLCCPVPPTSHSAPGALSEPGTALQGAARPAATTAAPHAQPAAPGDPIAGTPLRELRREAPPDTRSPPSPAVTKWFFSPKSHCPPHPPRRDPSVSRCPRLPPRCASPGAGQRQRTRPERGVRRAEGNRNGTERARRAVPVPPLPATAPPPPPEVRFPLPGAPNHSAIDSTACPPRAGGEEREQPSALGYAGEAAEWHRRIDEGSALDLAACARSACPGPAVNGRDGGAPQKSPVRVCGGRCPGL